MYVEMDKIKRSIIINIVPQINDNGVISFGSSFDDEDTPLPLPLDGDNRIIAPYWADVDIRGTGNICYRQTTDPSLLIRASSEISKNFPSVVVTWDSVGYYLRNIDKVCKCACIVCTFSYIIYCT